jgi:ElaB/YqjD/DUF883 family membrane-anchored ribosome-binding protein
MMRARAADARVLFKEECTMWGLAERKTSRFGRDLDMDDLYDQLDTLRGYVQELSRNAGRSAGHGYGRARDLASEYAQEAEDAVKDNLAVSLVVALGLGVLVGYFLHRSSQ